MAAIEGRAEERERIIDAALELAAQGRWSEVTLNAIADEAQVSLARIYEDFGSRGDILAAFFRRIDAEVLGEEEDALSEEEPARDRLFDVLMRRFEALPPYHSAVYSI